MVAGAERHETLQRRIECRQGDVWSYVNDVFDFYWA